MRFMVIVKANQDSESGVMPTHDELAEMGEFNDKLVEAGVMLAGEGLLASSKGSRIKFTDGKTTVTDGPFAETRELVAGFWIIKADSKKDAIEWMKRAPFRKGEELEIRQIAEAEDFGEEFTPELRAQEDRQRDQLEANARR